jgi:peroxiredoxin
MRNLIIILFAVTAFSSTGQVPDFILTNVMNDKTVSLANYKSSKGVVVIFIGQTCPYDNYYHGRISALINEYNSKTPVLLINAHPKETAEQMSTFGKAENFSVPYLADKDQVAMTILGAEKSPSVFLLKNEGGKWSKVYEGAIDDNPQVEAQVKVQFLKNAIEALLRGDAIAEGNHRPVGCSIRGK